MHFTPPTAPSNLRPHNSDITAHACQSLTLQASRFSCHNSHLAAFTSLLVYHTTDPLPRTVHFTRHNSYFKSTTHTSNRSSQTSVLGRHTTDLTSHHAHLALHSSNLTLDAPQTSRLTAHISDLTPHTLHLTPGSRPISHLTAHLAEVTPPACHRYLCPHATDLTAQT